MRDALLQMSDEVYTAMTTLRQFLYENVYRSPGVHNEFIKAKKIMSELFSYFLNNGDVLREELAGMKMPDCNHNNQARERIVCDMIASMTDRYAMNFYTKTFFPSPMV